MFSRILIPMDCSQTATAALTAGEGLARRWGAELQVLALVRRGEVQSGVQQIIDRQVKRIEPGTKVEVRSMSYSVAEDIAGEFDQVEDTLVVMTTWARGRSAGLLSNVSEDVLRLTRHPLIAIGPEAQTSSDWPTGPMFITTDGSDFGESIVPTAARMAKALSLEPRLITVIDPSEVPAGANPAAETNSLSGLAGEVESITGAEANYDVLHGRDPATEIADYARRYNASMVAMATHGRSGMSRLAFGSVAMGVVRQAECPVLLHRPAVDQG